MIINKKALDVIRENEIFNIFFCPSCWMIRGLDGKCCGQKVVRTAEIRQIERERSFHIMCNTGLMYDLTDWVENGILK